jgi:hypothetical protein
MAIRGKDRRAMQRAIEQMRNESAESRERVERVLRVEGFESAAQTAAYPCQFRALRLKPWMCPPAWAADEIDATRPNTFGNRPDEVALLKRMLAAGLSRFHPDPMRALTEIETKAAVKPA